MLTQLTQTALVVLYDIDYQTIPSCPESYALTSSQLAELLARLEQAGLITLLADGVQGNLRSYTLTRPATQISLLDVLEATGEHLNNVHCVDNDFYAKYGLAARKLGVINQVTRTCLSEINVTDIPTATIR